MHVLAFGQQLLVSLYLITSSSETDSLSSKEVIPLATNVGRAAIASVKVNACPQMKETSLFKPRMECNHE